eukprot:TRINITY_DN3192_c0_g1_i2.p1 TRINITY_DN3192_c0_g1~~TRINITY_DN3192_c0_g1_i2.p1  ORF type:complete len:676 (-),score=126.36 TRINITY_DN3192_c0_g1_i2:87-2114(-)
MDEQTSDLLLALVLGYHARTIIESRLSVIRQRAKIVKELLETERTYLHSISSLKNCLSQLRENRLLSQEQIYSIFSNIGNIFTCNSTLLNELEIRVSQWTDDNTIGDIFVQWAPAFKTYTTYCQNYDAAIASLRRCKQQHPKFEAFLKEFSNETKQTLQTLLITPVQRIPRYIMLLQELLKKTSKNHQDYFLLAKSMTDLQEITEKVNQSISHAENVSKVVTVQNQLESTDALPEGVQTIITAGRYFIREGLVKIICSLDSRNHRNHYKKRWFVLFNNSLLSCSVRFKEPKDAKDPKDTKVFKKSELILFSSTVLLKNIEDIGVVKNAFHLITPEKSFQVQCFTLDEKNSWMKDIEHFSSDSVKKVASLGAILSTRTPNGPDTAIKWSPTNELKEDNRLTAQIINTESKRNKNKEYTVYVINITRGHIQYSITRRYREFDELKKKLDSKYSDAKWLGDLPSKHIIRTMNKDVIESRRIMLDGFLQEILLHPQLRESIEVLFFLRTALPPPPSSYSSDLESHPTSSNRRKSTLDRLRQNRLTEKGSSISNSSRVPWRRLACMNKLSSNRFRSDGENDADDELVEKKDKYAVWRDTQTSISKTPPAKPARPTQFRSPSAKKKSKYSMLVQNQNPEQNEELPPSSDICFEAVTNSAPGSPNWTSPRNPRSESALVRSL